MTSTTPRLTVRDGVTVKIEGKRSFSRCTFGDCAASHARYASRPMPAEWMAHQVDYAWLNADAMVIDGRAKPEVPVVQYGDIVEYEGYGLFEIQEPGRMHGDHPRLVPAGRWTTDEQNTAIREHKLAIREWSTARVPGQPVTGQDGVLECVGTGDARYTKFHVFPDGSVHKLQHVGQMGRLDYVDPIGR